MGVMIEPLEGRTLYSHTLIPQRLAMAYAVGSSDWYVKMVLSDVYADEAAIRDARQRTKSATAENAAAVKAGAALLAADRRAILEAKGNPVQLEAAKAKLNADRQQLRADLAAARAELRADRAAAREAVRDATSSLRSNMKTLWFAVNSTGSGGGVIVGSDGTSR